MPDLQAVLSHDAVRWGLVVGLGILIVISFGLLIYGFYTKILGTREAAEPPVATNEAPLAPIAGFGDVRVTLPPGCEVTEMRPDGAGLLYLRLGPDGACRRIVVVDVASGREVGTLTLGP